jgi:ligand-binding sensor domain-containing protein
MFSGASWTKTALGSSEVFSFAVIGTNLFARTGGVARSTNDGGSWESVHAGLPWAHVTTLVASGTNLFVGTDSGVFLSTDNGTRWTNVSPDVTNKNISALAVNGVSLFAAIPQGGILRSTDTGKSWRTTGQTNGLFVYSFGVANGIIFAGTSYGISRSTDNGVSWESTSNGLSAGGGFFKSFSFVPSGKNLFVGIVWDTLLPIWGGDGVNIDRGGVFLSTDNGANWMAVNTGLPIYDRSVYSLAISGGNLFAGTAMGVLLSTNDGTTWRDATAGLPFYDVETVNALVVSGTNLFAGTKRGGVWRHPL